jgi:integrase
VGNSLTKVALSAKRPGQGSGDRWMSDGAVRGSGALWARVSSSGTSFYFRYTDSDGNKKAVALGGYDDTGAKGLSLPAARDRAGALSKLYRDGVKDLHAHLKREQDAAERAQIAEESAARAAQEDAQRGTLRQLLAAYVKHLEDQGKQSAGDVKSIFDLHVLKAAPDLADRKASIIRVDEFAQLIGKLVEAKKGRTALKLRSYLRAAYSLALGAKTDPSAPLSLQKFGIEINPVASVATKSMRRFNRARDRVLTAPELGAFLRRIDAIDSTVKRDALSLCLLLGGQRPVQLLRLARTDVDLDAATVQLYDGKGSRAQPRLHVLPLVKDAAAILTRRLAGLTEGEPVFSSDTESQMRIETLSNLVNEISSEMVKEKEAAGPFQLRDVRRTVETMLAGLKVSSDVRAQLQSHGLGGVQQRHYNRHEYSLEKKAALEKWARQLATLKAGKQADVVALNKAARSSAE